MRKRFGLHLSLQIVLFFSSKTENITGRPLLKLSFFNFELFGKSNHKALILLFIDRILFLSYYYIYAFQEEKMNNTNSIAKSGINAAILKQDVSAHNTVNINTEEFQQSQPIQTEKKNGGTEVSAIRKTDTYESSKLSNTDTAEEMAAQNTNKSELTANTKALKKQQEMEQEIIDLRG